MNQGKYRKISIIAVIVLSITWLAALAALWNSLLTTDAKHEGWVILFMILVLASGIVLFYAAFVASDLSVLEKTRDEAYENGRSDLLMEIEHEKRVDLNEQKQAEDTRKVIDAILSGINGARSESGLCNKLLSGLARELGFVQGIMYVKNKKDPAFYPAGEYALTGKKPEAFKEGETLAGQAALDKSINVIYDIPENYFSVSSGLGNSMPGFLLIAPVVFNNESIAVLELATFSKPDDKTGEILEKVLSEAGNKISKIIAAS